MSVSQVSSATKPPKGKRNSMNRPQSAGVDGDFYITYRNDVDGGAEPQLAYRTRLHSLFKQIEREFDLICQENQNLREKVEQLNEKLDTNDKQTYDGVDIDNNLSKAVAKKLSSTSSQKLKTAHKLKAQTSKIVSSFKAPQFGCCLVKEYVGHKDGVWEVSVARPGQPIIGTASADHSAFIWSIDSGRCLLQYHGHSGSVNSIRFHPLKDLVLTASGDCSAHIWQAVVNWDVPKGHSSDEELDADCVDDGIARPSTQSSSSSSTLRTPVRELQGHGGAVAAADWLAGGDHAITAGWDRVGLLHDVETAATLGTLTGHDLELTHAAAHPSRRLALTSSRDTTFRLWDFRETVHSVSVFQGHTESVTSAVFARDDRVVSSSDDRTAKVWDLRNMRSPAATIRADSPANRLAVSAASGVVAVPHDNRNVRLYDLAGQRLGRLPRSSRRGHRRMVAAVAWADDNGPTAANLFTCGFDRRVLGWSVQSLKDQ